MNKTQRFILTAFRIATFTLSTSLLLSCATETLEQQRAKWKAINDRAAIEYRSDRARERCEERGGKWIEDGTSCGSRCFATDGACIEDTD